MAIQPRRGPLASADSLPPREAPSPAPPEGLIARPSHPFLSLRPPARSTEALPAPRSLGSLSPLRPAPHPAPPAWVLLLAPNPSSAPPGLTASGRTLSYPLRSPFLPPSSLPRLPWPSLALLSSPPLRPTPRQGRARRRAPGRPPEAEGPNSDLPTRIPSIPSLRGRRPERIPRRLRRTSAAGLSEPQGAARQRQLLQPPLGGQRPPEARARRSRSETALKPFQAPTGREGRRPLAAR